MKPYPFQSKAVRQVCKELKAHSRAKAIMPCGTGKTLVGMLVRKQLKPKRSLVTAPSLALVKQLLDSYSAESELPRILVVCSDDTAAKEARERYDIPSVTTDPDVITKELRRNDELIVFSTYQSTPRIAEAFEKGRVPAFDFGLFDEAHRMAGGSLFSTALDDSLIRIRKRLFMTATPRVAVQSAKQQAEEDGLPFASMDDESQFGREAFYMSFNDAIDGGYLTDYRVAVFVIKESEIHSLVDSDDDAKEVAKRVALVRAMQQHDIRKVLAYHSTVKQMNWFADIGLRKTFSEFRDSGHVDGTLWVGALDGSDNARIRKSALDKFASLNGDHRAVLNNCQVLQEGVDCPSVDAVALIAPRSQPVDIVQIVGRAIRKSPDKKISTIILPVFMPANCGDDVEGFVSSSEFAPVWDVLGALKSHDDRVQGWVDNAKRSKGKIGDSHVEFNFDMPATVQGRFFNAIESRIARRLWEPMPLTEELVWEWMQAYREEHGEWPTLQSHEPCPDGSTWVSVNSAMIRNARGYSGPRTIAELRRKKLGLAPLHCHEKLTEDIIWVWLQDYFMEHGKWPTTASKEKCPDGSAWHNIESWLLRKLRGLTAGMSLAAFRKSRTGENDLTEEKIISWMRDYFKEHGDWPKGTTKSLAPCFLPWTAINSALKKGCRGLPGGSTLFQLQLQLDPSTPKGPIDHESAWKWMQEYKKTHGRWPAANDRSLATNGITWHQLDGRLRHRERPTSLAKLRDKMLARELVVD